MFSDKSFEYVSIHPDDASFTYRLRSARYDHSCELMISPRPTTLEREREWIQQMPTQVDRVYFLVKSKADHKPVAYVFLSQIEMMHRRAHVGVIVDPDCRGRGVGRAAVRFIVDYATQHLNLRKLYAHVLKDNAASLQLFESLGFVAEGTLKEYHYSCGRYQDVHILGWIRSDGHA